MDQPREPTSTDQHGFILITSLLFLVIITLLALSGIGSSTLQQKMATNSNDKAASLQATNSTLAYVEALIQHMPNAPPNPANSPVRYCKPNNKNKLISKTKNCSGKTVTMIIDQNFNRRTAKGWLKPHLWNNWEKNNKVQSYKPSNYNLKTTYRITVTPTPPPNQGYPSPGQGLNPSQNARPNKHDYYFTITAYSKGPKHKGLKHKVHKHPKAPAVTQSVYRKRY